MYWLGMVALWLAGGGLCIVVPGFYEKLCQHYGESRSALCACAAFVLLLIWLIGGNKWLVNALLFGAAMLVWETLREAWKNTKPSAR